jgi:hypothetical protein
VNPARYHWRSAAPMHAALVYNLYMIAVHCSMCVRCAITETKCHTLLAGCNSNKFLFAVLYFAALADALKAAQCLPTGTPGQTPVNHPPCSGATGNSRRQQPSRVRGGAGGSAGTSSRGEAAAPAAELRVGDRVQVLAVNDHVAAVGTVTALTEGFLLSEHPDDAAAKVCVC